MYMLWLDGAGLSVPNLRVQAADRGHAYDERL